MWFVDENWVFFVVFCDLYMDFLVMFSIFLFYS